MKKLREGLNGRKLKLVKTLNDFFPCQPKFLIFSPIPVSPTFLGYIFYIVFDMEVIKIQIDLTTCKE